MGAPEDLTGKTFGRLTAIRLCSERDQFGFRVWLWKCSCGAEIERPSGPIKKGTQVSCGCNKIEKRKAAATHGMHSTRTYRAWIAMKARVQGRDDDDRKNYGDRGIVVHEPWLEDFPAFLRDVGECPEGMSLDRYPNNDGNYEPGNVRWATQQQQVSNTRRTVWIRFGDVEMCLKDACAAKGVNYDRIRSRIRSGIEPQAAFDAP